MSEKQKKRLVGRKQYLEARAQKGANYSLAVVFACGGLWGLILGTVLFFGCFYVLFNPLYSGHESWLQYLISSVLALDFGIAAMWGAKSLYDHGKKIKSVTLITRHNTGDLPEVETLVRASGLPSSHQQAELLRVAQEGSEAPPEELLRATTNSKGIDCQNFGEIPSGTWACVKVVMMGTLPRVGENEDGDVCTICRLIKVTRDERD